MNGFDVLSDCFTEEEDEIQRLEDNPGSLFRVIHTREGFDDETFLVRFLEGEQEHDELLEADNRELELQFYDDDMPNQWNIQLFWAYNDSNKPEKDIRQKLERDTRFAMRRCVPVESLEDFITPLEQSLRGLEKVSPDFERKDLIQRIIDHDLEFLFNRNTNREQKLELVKEEATEEDTDTLPERKHTAGQRAFIDSIKLGNFRKPASERKLDAAPFTLLYGRNGTGKTSLLDGTAMGLVGQIRRDEARVHEYEGLGVTLEGDTDPLPTDTGDVNDRVADWFGFRPQGSANRFIEFYRVNYHEAGETTRLLQSGTELEIEPTIRRFLYGEDLIYAKNEKDKLTELLKQQADNLTDDIEESENELQELKNKKSELDSIFSTLDTATKDLSDAATTIIQSSTNRDKNPENRDATSPTERIEQWATWEQRFRRLRESFDAVSEQGTSQTTPNQLERQLQADLEQLEEYLSKLDDVERLFEDRGRLDTLDDYYGDTAPSDAPASVVLIALILRVNSIEKEDIHLLVETLRAIDYEELVPEYANSVAEWQDAVSTELREELEELEERQEKLEELSDIEERRRQLQAEIRKDTEEYLSMTDEVQYCPACYTEQTAEEILTRDKPPHLHDGTNGVPESLTEQIAAIEDALSILSSSSWDTIHRDIDGRFSDLCNFESFQELWENHLSNNEMEIIFPKSSDSYLQTLVDALRSDPKYQVPSTPIKIVLESAIKRLDANLVDQASSIPKFEPDRGGIQEFRERYLDRRDDIEGGLTVLESHWPDNAWKEEIDIKGDLQTFRATVEDMEDRQTIPASSQKLSTDINEVENMISRRKERHSQCQEGISRLTSAFEGAQSEEKLDEFIRQHMTVITTLFKAFQRPYHFDSVELIDGEVKVTRRNEETPVKITKMSSGQRAALTLAIFVTNNLAHDSAPPLMMLDEPFAHLDDVNTVSFFNLLIELATRKQRQVMFATANEDIAALLERKVGDSSKFKKAEIGEPE